MRHVLRAFALYISIVKPLDETRKLQLTGGHDRARVLPGAFISEGKCKHPDGGSGGLDGVGAEYRAHRGL